ncbi:hypothetical protein BDP55DRAFT_248712 [Colletotrichum godetiae]|uniref:Uncharacterized protein n=1 Tax=Colletotrichum godetiae TaxID=1209918 RepID=A0AAJ0AEV8_9PEZI|nr:uncharacterized protein BDP55DRAFT_248712 [Colletotrichum godetiae]KAK1672611.1 hypothetical protein BDP55DRAFT_248712 [Colletotrichum godetiae]
MSLMAAASLRFSLSLLYPYLSLATLLHLLYVRIRTGPVVWATINTQSLILTFVSAPEVPSLKDSLGTPSSSSSSRSTSAQYHPTTSIPCLRTKTYSFPLASLCKLSNLDVS